MSGDNARRLAENAAARLRDIAFLPGMTSHPEAKQYLRWLATAMDDGSLSTSEVFGRRTHALLAEDAQPRQPRPPKVGDAEREVFEDQADCLRDEVAALRSRAEAAEAALQRVVAVVIHHCAGSSEEAPS